ncbi:alpha/beta hydrolase [Zavarzinella formosa]|uniref:alpha/beta hydrolase n=1 Tax=Zavarzinella formosa TaxID=360055 RepID=UPI0002E501D8|nr:acetylxylan esterase [Zavarzinella formosa]
MRVSSLLMALAPFLMAADVSPGVFPPDDPRAKELPKMMGASQRQRIGDAGQREAAAFAEVRTREQWEKFRDARIAALRESLGVFPEPPKETRVVVTKKFEGDGFRIHNIVFESRPGFWVSGNLYLPAKPTEKMPGFLISHSHHTSKTNGELQDMGMTWARAGGAVLVPDHLGYGERRQHPFATAKDYPKEFKASRQDYYHRYVTNLQLTALGDSLMGWMAWDLMRGVDVLLQQPGIDRERIILLGAVAGGGDPAGVTAALDKRIACVVPFNFGGWQPESAVTKNPDREFDWFGDGYWESTRGLRGGAANGFAHWVIVGSVAPRRLISAHEFSWDQNSDPTWPRLQKVFGFYEAADHLGFAHGIGTLRGNKPTDSHCTHIGAVHRKMIYPQLEKWFGLPVPTEYSKRLPSEELLCWTETAKKELEPKSLGAVLGKLADERGEIVRASTETGSLKSLRAAWSKILGDITPVTPKLIADKSVMIPGGWLQRAALQMEPGIIVPLLLFSPPDGEKKAPVVVMFAQGGKAALLKEREEEIAAFRKAGIAVCLVDLRGTGETRPGASGERGSSRTSISQTEQILGGTVLGGQLRDLRTVIGWLRTLKEIDGARIGLWGNSFAATNPADRNIATPLDAPDMPTIGEPGTALLALLGGLFDEEVRAIHARGGLENHRSLLAMPEVWVPHDAIVPGVIGAGDLPVLRKALGERMIGRGNLIDGGNRTVKAPADSASESAGLMVKRLKEK